MIREKSIDVHLEGTNVCVIVSDEDEFGYDVFVSLIQMFSEKPPHPILVASLGVVYDGQSCVTIVAIGQRGYPRFKTFGDASDALRFISDTVISFVSSHFSGIYGQEFIFSESEYQIIQDFLDHSFKDMNVIAGQGREKRFRRESMRRLVEYVDSAKTTAKSIGIDISLLDEFKRMLEAKTRYITEVG